MKVPASKNPNSEVSVYAGAAMVLVSWIVENWVDVPDFVWAACTTLVIGAILYAGKRSRKP